MKHGTVRVVHYDRNISRRVRDRKRDGPFLLYRVRIQGQMMGMNERYYGRACIAERQQEI